MADTRCYKTPEVLAKLQMAIRTFQRLKAAGKLPFLEELHPRLGRHPRYRADLVDKYLAGGLHPEASRFFSHGRRAEWHAVARSGVEWPHRNSLGFKKERKKEPKKERKKFLSK